MKPPWPAPPPRRCAALVSYVGQFTPDQCSNTATKGEFCGIHHPDAVARRKAKSVAYHEKHAERDAQSLDMKRRARDRAERVEFALTMSQDLLCDVREALKQHNHPGLLVKLHRQLQHNINALKEVQ